MSINPFSALKKSLGFTIDKDQERWVSNATHDKAGPMRGIKRNECSFKKSQLIASKPLHRSICKKPYINKKLKLIGNDVTMYIKLKT